MAYMLVDFLSSSLRRKVGVAVSIPTDGEASGPYRSLYLLHGVYGDATSWMINSRVLSYAQRLNLCIVMPSGENKFYADSPVTGDLYGTFVGKELVSFTRKTFPLSHKREDTFIGGLSMGGFGAITNGLRNPQTFGGIVALSAALIKEKIVDAAKERGDELFSKRECEAMFGLRDAKEFAGSDNDYEHLAEMVAGTEEKPRFFLSCGTEDTLYPANERYQRKLSSLGFDVTWKPDEGTHDWDFWDKTIISALQWL